MEDPFTILPMQAFCDKIYNWCMEIVSWEAGDNGMPEPLEQPRTVSSKGTTGIVAEDSASVDKPTFFVETTTRIDEIEEIVSSPINEDEEIEDPAVVMKETFPEEETKDIVETSADELIEDPVVDMKAFSNDLVQAAALPAEKLEDNIVADKEESVSDASEPYYFRTTYK